MGIKRKPDDEKATYQEFETQVVYPSADEERRWCAARLQSFAWLS